jgi:hypothetical protein
MGRWRRRPVGTIGYHGVGDPHLFVLLRSVIVSFRLRQRIAKYEMMCLNLVSKEFSMTSLRLEPANTQRNILSLI